MRFTKQRPQERRRLRCSRRTARRGTATLALLALLVAPLWAQKGLGAEEKKQPQLDSISPQQQRVGEIITLRGINFGSYDPQSCEVRFVSESSKSIFIAGTPYVWRDDFIQVYVPVGRTQGRSTLAIEKASMQILISTSAGTSASRAFRVISRNKYSPALRGGLQLQFQQKTNIVNNMDVSGFLPMNAARTKDAEVGDVNNDGRPDLVDNNSNNQQNGTHGVLRINSGLGGFGAIALEPLAANDNGGPFATFIANNGDFPGNTVIYDADLADITGDQFPDLIQGAARTGNRIRLLINNGGSSFSEDTANRLPVNVGNNGCPDDIAHGDLNNDGAIDFGASMRTAAGCGSAPSPNKVFINNGGGFFAAPITLQSGGSSHDMVFMDANLDGFRDIVVINEPGASSQVFINNGNPVNPSFNPGQTLPSGFSGVAADFNGDGRQDLAIIGSGGGGSIQINTTGGFVQRGLSSTGAGTLYDIEAGDIDLDGDIDLVAAVITQAANDTVRIWLNDGAGFFTEITDGGAGQVLPGIGPYQRLSADLLDFDGDGDLDLYITGADGQDVGMGFGAVPNQFYENLLMTPPPDDDPPVAVFTAACQGFSCSFDGSNSHDDNGIVSHSWDFGDGSPAGSGVTVPHVYALAGTYTATLTVTDTIGQIDSASQSLEIGCGDVIRPTVSLTAPQNGQVLWGAVTMAASASDNVGVDRVQFRVNGDVVCTDSQGPQWSCTIDADDFTTDDYELRALAFDGCGNFRLSTGVNVRFVSNPEMAVDLPVEGGVVTGESVQIQGWATDPDGVDTVLIRFDDQATVPSTYGTGRSDVCQQVPVADPNCPFVGFAASFDSSAYDNGPHFIDVWSTDTTGKVSHQHRDFVIDNPLPDPCTPNNTTLCLRNGRFQVRTTFIHPVAGDQRDAKAVSNPDGTDKSGFFYFFNPDNLEVGVKVLGVAGNGFWWVFQGPATDVEYTLTVTDTSTGDVKTYVKERHSFCGDPDTQAFPGGGQALVFEASPDLRRSSKAANGAAGQAVSASCVPGSQNLCLLNNRFKVEVERAGQLQTALPLTSLSGGFWFFDVANVEVLIKVLDGSGVNNKIWVFAATLSDVQYTLRVTDTLTGEVQEYLNPQGNFCGFGDTQAFDP